MFHPSVRQPLSIHTENSSTRRCVTATRVLIASTDPPQRRGRVAATDRPTVPDRVFRTVADSRRPSKPAHVQHDDQHVVDHTRRCHRPTVVGGRDAVVVRWDDGPSAMTTTVRRCVQYSAVYRRQQAMERRQSDVSAGGRHTTRPPGAVYVDAQRMALRVWSGASESIRRRVDRPTLALVAFQLRRALGSLHGRRADTETAVKPPPDQVCQAPRRV